MTEQELGDLIRVKDPSVVFIPETWMDEVRLKKMEVIVVALLDLHLILVYHPSCLKEIPRLL